ncbi:MAG TPA: type II secretion system F family protein [Burkholderiaceae bacterium]|jgi:tight adherence protein B|nr:type II secretion system F family protein [Burkholderiaceae bacterium]
MNQGLITLVIGALSLAATLLLLQAAVSGYGAYRRRFTDEARSQLEGAFVFIDPERVLLLTVFGAVVVPPVLWLLTGQILLPAVVAVLAIVLPSVAYALIHRRRRAQIVLQLPDVLLMLGSSLRAGTSLQIGLDLAIRETPAPLSQELAVVMREQRLGMALEEALDTMARRLKLEEVDLVVTALTIARDIGGNLAETLDRLAGTLRTKAMIEGKIRSLTSQGKLQGMVVGALPVGMAFVLSAMEPDAMQPLFHTWWGWAVVAVIGVLELVGFLMIRKIVNIDV